MAEKIINNIKLPNGEVCKIGGLDGNITNCLLEVPQRIKLELNNGVLTLKAGSQVIVPNGFEDDGVTPRFDYVDIESDKTYTATTNGTCALFYTPTLSTLNGGFMSVLGSGTSVPTTGDSIYYKTDTNTLAYYNNGALQYSRSFPLALFTVSNNTITSINQIFNGVGYIGSTIWVDKGVKGLISNGRNEDRTLSNIEFTTDKVMTREIEVGEEPHLYIFYNLNSRVIGFDGEDGWEFDKEENRWRFISTGVYYPMGVLGTFSYKSNAISNFNPKQPFRAVDYNEASGLGMPSSKYIDLTLGASGTLYTAPANGYFQLNKQTTGNNQFIYFQDNSNLMLYTLASISYTGGLWCHCQVAKGKQIQVHYSAGGQVELFRFIYAEGEV